jgi:hemoglobin
MYLYGAPMTPADNSQRRAQLTQEIRDRTGIDEAMIEALVTAFYAQVRLDPLIGPIFEDKVKDWDHHLNKLCAFWSSVTLMSGRYHGQPMQAHMSLRVGREHFDRWLQLFEATANDICPPVAAAHFIERAHRIADSLELGIATARGEIQTPRWERTGSSR